MRTIVGGILIVAGWLAYLGATGYGIYVTVTLGFAALVPDPQFGDSAIWFGIGVILWGATEWFDSEFLGG